MTLKDIQDLINRMYSDKDRERGVAATYMWFCEEIGELAGALREGTREEIGAEFADVLAWLITLANISDVDLTQEMHKKYGDGCPGCGLLVCSCDSKP
ncbi:MAG: MazG nucleotide pyrophosphohydrolase domain-containing protein [Planctomycetota bacterium]|jgi:NTP pyrophosphatase (non-canonical NTP hydrolase)